MSTFGFQLFGNGGLPLIERRFGPFREEILLVPAPNMVRRAELPFGVRVHLSSTEIARVRGRFWRPPTRAPHLVAVGDLGQLSGTDQRIVWLACGGIVTAQLLAQELTRIAVPWFDLFKEPRRLKERLYAGEAALIDDCTALELLLAEFDPYEARRYLRLRVTTYPWTGCPIEEPSGFDLTEDRMAPIASYYRL